MKKIVEQEGGIFPKRSWRYDEAAARSSSRGSTSIIVEAAKKFDVDAALVSAVIKAESDFNPREISNKGARGLMQLMPAPRSASASPNAYDPAANIYGGVRYLRWLLQTFDGNADLAVAAYNAGEGNVWKYNGVPPFRETINYINRIAKHIRARAEIPDAAGGRMVVSRPLALLVLRFRVPAAASDFRLQKFSNRNTITVRSSSAGRVPEWRATACRIASRIALGERSLAAPSSDSSWSKPNGSPCSSWASTIPSDR